MLVAADDDVVKQLDVEQFARFAQLLGGAHVLGRGGRIAGWMVVDDDHAGAGAGDRRAEDFGHAHRAAVDGSLVDGLLRDDVVVTFGKVCRVQPRSAPML
jgi:hypothetical protein